MNAIDLETCAKRFQGASHCRALIEAWRGWRRNEPDLPRVSDVRPEDLGQSVGGVSVLEAIDPENVVYRLFGGYHAGLTGRNLKGRNYIDMGSPEDRERRIERLWNLVTYRCGAVFDLGLARPPDPATRISGVILPILADSPDGSMRLYAAISVDADIDPDIRFRKPVKQVTEPGEYTYIDLGCGVPDLMDTLPGHTTATAATE